MAKQIARLLKTDIMADLDLPGIAQLLESKGRKGDTMLAHITPQEAALLKARGGAGTMNPDTGLPEFYDGTEDTYFSPSRAGRVSTDQDSYYRPSRQAVEAVPEPSIEEFSLSPYSFSPDTSQVTLTPPDQTYSADINYQPVFDIGAVGGGRYDPTTYGMTPEALVTQQFPVNEQLSAIPPAPPLPAAQPSFLERTADYFKRPETLEKLGLAGLQALPGILQAREARKQGQRAKEEMQRLGAPYQQQGQALVAQAQRGELTAPGQQQIQALQARAAQGVAARGGVGAEQAAAQVEAFRQQLLQGQYDMGLKVANIGDQIAAGAIRTGLSADQYVNELTNNYFSNMARTLYGTPQTGQTQTPR